MTNPKGLSHAVLQWGRSGEGTEKVVSMSLTNSRSTAFNGAGPLMPRSRGALKQDADAADLL